MSDIYTLGIDVGSTASKCIILKNGCEIVSKSLIGVGAGTSGPERAIKQVLDGCGMKKEDMAYTLATGYGRNSLMGLADQQMSELSCHAKGATFLFPDVHTVIDIGGQDVKILHIENGKYNFAMSILKSSDGNPESCSRFTYAYEKPVNGEGRFIHTYMNDGNPLPSFEGEPKRVAIEGDIDSFTANVWENLNEDNKVSLFVRFIDIETGKYETRIVNKNH